jgi:hypothetical protein
MIYAKTSLTLIMLRSSDTTDSNPSADVTKLDFTDLGSDEGNDSETRFAAKLPFQTSHDTSQRFISRFKAYSYI